MWPDPAGLIWGDSPDRLGPVFVGVWQNSCSGMTLPHPTPLPLGEGGFWTTSTTLCQRTRLRPAERDFGAAGCRTPRRKRDMAEKPLARTPKAATEDGR